MSTTGARTEADRLEREAQRLLTAATQETDPERVERLVREAKRLRAIAAKETRHA
jgi:hypothetical protein